MRSVVLARRATRRSAITTRPRFFVIDHHDTIAATVASSETLKMRRGPPQQRSVGTNFTTIFDSGTQLHISGPAIDISRFSGCAIVNAADETMLSPGGIDGVDSIHTVAGPGLLAACKDFPEVHDEMIAYHGILVRLSSTSSSNSTVHQMYIKYTPHQSYSKLAHDSQITVNVIALHPMMSTATQCDRAGEAECEMSHWRCTCYERI